jgi:hypothetical protein
MALYLYECVNPDPDPAFPFTRLDPSFGSESRTAPDQSEGNLRPLVYSIDLGSILSLQAAIASVRIQLFSNADPDPAFHSNADPDPTSKNNADPDPQP